MKPEKRESLTMKKQVKEKVERCLKTDEVKDDSDEMTVMG